MQIAPFNRKIITETFAECSVITISGVFAKLNNLSVLQHGAEFIC
ncbi:hypothetical protein l13_00930 [Neisseria weaveri ATCC 51223]|nr:hypothetical protein l13_00930 [Neisseria weaveri ATCC 51223]